MDTGGEMFGYQMLHPGSGGPMGMAAAENGGPKAKWNL